MSEDIYLVPGAVPAQFAVMEPEVSLVMDTDATLEAYAGACTGCMLDVCADTYSRWFLVMRGAIGRERARQQEYREANHLPKAAKVDYTRPTLDKEDISTARSCESTVRHVFGDAVANYARERFYNAIATGDMRSFKIRLLVLKTRDSIASKLMRDLFSEGMEECISKAEAAAGCIACPGPRRLSRKEREHKLAREANNPEAAKSHNVTDVQDIERSDAEGSTGGDVSGAEDKPVAQEQEVVSSVVDGNTLRYDENPPSTKCTVTESNNNDDSTVQGRVPEVENTVRRTVRSTVKNSATKKLPHKIRQYHSVSEILSDIHAGRIRPYEDDDEIIADMKSGVITPGEAFLFTAELDKRKPIPEEKGLRGKLADTEEDEDKDDLSSLADEIIARESGDEDDFGDSGDDGFEDQDEPEEDEDDDEDEDTGYRRRRSSGRVRESYGYGGLGYGGYNASGSEWCPDDDC